jgi:hypothetical protein
LVFLALNKIILALKTLVIFIVIVAFASCIIVEEYTTIDYIIENDTERDIELINESFDFKPGEYHQSESGILTTKDSLVLSYFLDGISRAVDTVPFYSRLDSLLVVYNSSDTVIHYYDNRNGIEHNIFEVKNWSGGMIDKSRHHHSYSFRYVFEE